MKTSKRQLRDAIVLLGLLVVVGLITWSFPRFDFPSINWPPSYSSLQQSCASAIQKTPQIGTVETWLNANRIPYHLEKVPLNPGTPDFPLSDGFLANCWRDVGLPKTSIARSTSYISFGAIPVRWGGSAQGYFLFSANGTLVDYRLQRIGQPL